MNPTNYTRLLAATLLAASATIPEIGKSVV